MSTKHPSDRGDEGRSPFDRAAEAASNITSSPVFFAFCVALIGAWALSFALDWATSAQDLLGYGMAAVSLLLLALLKNSERRAERAIQQKLDAIAAALLHQRTGEGEQAERDLERAIGLHDEL